MSKRILYVQYTNPCVYPPLQHSAQQLANQGWRVLFIGTQGRDVEKIRFSDHPNIHTQLWPFQDKGIAQKIQFFAYNLWVIWTVCSFRPHWIYASDLFACPVAWFMSRMRQRVIYHEHDSPNESDAHTFFLELILLFRKKLAKTAQACVLPNSERAKIFLAQTRGKEALVVWNCPALNESARSDQLWRVGKKIVPLNLYFHGNLSVKLFPESFFRALGSLGRDACGLHIIGYETAGSEGSKQILVNLANKFNVNLRIDEAMPRQMLWPHLEQAHVGFFLAPKKTNNINMKNLIGASNKIFDYMAGGLALLVGDDESWRNAYVEPGFGLACDPEDYESILRALLWFIEHPRETVEMGKRGREKIRTDWHYEKQFEPVSKLLNSAL